VLATVLSGLVNLLVSVVPLALIMLAVGHPFSPSLAFLPVSMILAAVFALGLSLLLAPLSILFADVVPIYQVVLTAWLYVTPVMYPADMVPLPYRRLVAANPMTYFVEIFRAPIFSGVLPAGSVLACAAAFALGALVLGWLVFDRYSDRVAYLI
jgi:ABC-type polysaccharide/polyol phosphate export permease